MFLLYLGIPIAIVCIIWRTRSRCEEFEHPQHDWGDADVRNFYRKRGKQ